MSFIIKNEDFGFPAERPENLEKIFPQTKIPGDAILEILEKFDHKELGVVRRSSKLGNKVASSEYLTKRAIFNKFGFSPKEWNKFCGKKVVSDEEINEALNSLPNNIHELIKSPCPMVSGKTVGDTHMLFYIPISVNGEAVTLRSFAEFLKLRGEFSNNRDGYRHISETILEEFGDLEIAPGWRLLAKDVLPATRGISYEEQVVELEYFNEKHGTHYQVPSVGEVVLGIYTHYFKSDKRCLSDNPESCTRCEEQIFDVEILVGGFSKLGALIFESPIDDEGIGVMPLIRL